MTIDIKNVLVAMTTYPGNFEHRMILHKVLKHFRWRNGWDVKLAVFSDGIMNDPVVSQANGRWCVRVLSFVQLRFDKTSDVP